MVGNSRANTNLQVGWAASLISTPTTACLHKATLELCLSWPAREFPSRLPYRRSSTFSPGLAVLELQGFPIVHFPLRSVAASTYIWLPLFLGESSRPMMWSRDSSAARRITPAFPLDSFFGSKPGYATARVL